MALVLSWAKKNGKKVVRECSDPQAVNEVVSELKGDLKPRTFVSCTWKHASSKGDGVPPVIQSIVRSGLFVLLAPECDKDSLSTQRAWALANGHDALAAKQVDIFENLAFDEQHKFLSELYKGQKKLKVIK